ncbi:zinc-dependent alcohol dehydrogenase [Lysinibacillus odysseyi]|uniref:Alcohol dehydrogenase n=1 Tax=Lysinibacillus odysseyi 34hs-1 = NBRC 100172 TaxID=1220589 RepID=A0A0A3ID60_9BACI|nr:alcohol dehydrogenase catalytic domain-containing protein [Lysinibacillus odysseyi]KGR82679.1 hypothetical protein CD32_17650 [Lysinibacillus odysseyi 34hs-1 = NBRC 100172]
MYKAFVKKSAAKRDFQIEERAFERLLPDQVRLRVKAVGICGSDLHMYDGHSGYDWVTYPLVLGHEVVGVVEEVGSEQSKSLLQKTVVINPYKPCGACEFCLAGNENRCDASQFQFNKTPIESLRYGFREAGGLAESMIVDVQNVIPIDPVIEDGVAAISEALTVSYTAIKKVGNYGAKRLLIVGPGPIGLGVAAIAIGAGNKDVTILGTEADQERLALAERMGVRQAITSIEELAVEGFDGLDAVIDCSGYHAVPAQVLPYLKRGGQLVLVGISANEFSVPMDQIVRGEIQIQGSYGITNDNYCELLKLAADKNYPFSKIVHETVPFEQVEKGFEKALNRSPGKVVIQMGEGKSL